MLKLRIIEGSDQGRLVDLVNGVLEIGRENCTLTLDDDDVSRRHAKISYDGDTCVVNDLNSTNGVRVNGELIQGTRPLTSGDRLGIGKHIFLVTDERDVLPTDIVDQIQSESRVKAGVAPSTPRNAINGLVIIGGVVIVIAILGFILIGGTSRDEPDEAPPSMTDLPDFEMPRAPQPRVGPSPRDTTTVQSAPEETVGNLWVDTLPRGASVLVDGDHVGTSPVLVRRLAHGPHTLRMELPGYLPLERAVHLPDDEPDIFEFQLADGSCLITSTPTGATLMLAGSQILGQTPFVMRGFAPGQYTINCVETGYRPQKIPVTLSAYRSTTAHVDLRSETGNLALVTIPPGVDVFLDKHPKGQSLVNPDNPLESLPIYLSGMKAGEHIVTIQRGDHKVRQRARIIAGRTIPMRLMIWVPDTRVRTIDEKIYQGMLKGKNALGDITLALTPKEEITLIATQIVDVEPLSAEEAAELQRQIRKSRRLRN